VLTSLAWGADWYRYEATLTWREKPIRGGSNTFSADVYVLISNDWPPCLSVEDRQSGSVYWSGRFDQSERTLQFQSSDVNGNHTVVGKGSFNSSYSGLNLRAWSLVWGPGNPTAFSEIRVRGKFLDIISR